ncbi:MAG: DUF4404 family protein [Acidimicrobiia bacterium]
MRETVGELLARLKEEIDRAEHGEDNREVLAALAGQLERRLDPDEDDEDGLVDDLRDGVRRFEVTHPELADLIGRAADALSSIGL